MEMTAAFEFSPQLQLRHDPGSMIRSLDDAANILNAHALAFADREAARFHNQIVHCATHDTAAMLANEFQRWAMQRGLLLANNGKPATESTIGRTRTLDQGPAPTSI
jgi:hypothetical protein